MAYKIGVMTIKQLVASIASVQKFLKSNDLKKIVDESINELQPKYNKRIFVDGRDSTGRKIGKYSTNPFFLKVKDFPVPFRPTLNALRAKRKTGKKGRPKLANGVFFKGGYKEFRKVVGLQNRFVDLNLTGKTRKAVRIARKGNKIQPIVTGERANRIMSENEKRFNTRVLDPTPKEIAQLAKSVQRKVVKVVRELMKRKK